MPKNSAKKKMTYTCEKCEKVFKKKYNYESHLKRKKPCNQNLQCSKCKKGFSNKYTLKRHVEHNICGSNSNGDEDTDKEIEKLKLQIELAKLQQSNTINSHNNTINIQQTVNYNLNAFGQENNDYIIDDEKFLKFALRDAEAGAKRMFKLRHFHPDYPENHNIKMTDFARKKLLVYDGNKWLSKPMHEIESTEGAAAYEIVKEFLEKKSEEGVEISQREIDRFISVFQDREFQKILSEKGYVMSVTAEEMDQSKLLEN